MSIGKTQEEMWACVNLDGNVDYMDFSEVGLDLTGSGKVLRTQQ